VGTHRCNLIESGGRFQGKIPFPYREDKKNLNMKIFKAPPAHYV
jgi:hypothetical protein